jgi:SAM-dependent methyltransferase
MESMTTVRIKGNSKKAFSSDALDFYKDYWQKGTGVSPRNLEHRKSVLKTVFPSGLAGKRIAELGVGGEGGFLYLLKDLNETLGFDASESAVELCRQHGLKVKLSNLDADRIPLPNHSIDVVFAMEVFEHFASPQSVIEEIKRILAPQGTALISTPNPLVYHWPRLFYPELFQRHAFYDFLIANGFRIEKRFDSKELPFRLPETVNKAWHWLWYCSKMDEGNAQTLFEFGLHFWDQKDAAGFRQKPIEAIEFFRKCHHLEPDVLRFRFYLTRALIYRFINGETDEFAEHYNFLIHTISNGSPARKRDALYHLAMMYVDLEKLGNNHMRKAVFDEALDQLDRIPDSGPYAEKIMKARRSPNP